MSENSQKSKADSNIPSSPSSSNSSHQNSEPKPKRQLSLDEYTEGILKGDRVILSRAITLIESTLPEHNELAQQIIENCLPHTGNSIRVGITGIPGAGKSTFIDVFGTYLTREKKRKVAVLAIDPTSERSRGSILGDKTRMEKLSSDENAFIRPSPTGGSLGGVARKTREAILLSEAAGFDTILVETVGVGQSEITVHSMVDFFLLLVLPGSGDEIQGIKRGITEMADAIAITKADGDNKPKADRARKEFKNAMQLFPVTESGWEPKVITCSAMENEGIEPIWETILEHRELLHQKSCLEKKRMQQAKYWMHQTIKHILEDRFYEDQKIKKEISEFEQRVAQGEISSSNAARKLLDIYFGESS